MRLEQLTFTRFIAAILIVFFHYGRDSAFLNNKYTGFLLNQASLCVSYFFILSGFVMIIAYNNHRKINTLEYFRNRFSRIYPVYFVGLILVVAISILLNRFKLHEILLSLFMIQSWVPGKALTQNYPAWSISVELLFYILFPFLFNRIYKKINLKIITFSILLFWLISQVFFETMLISRPLKGFPLSNADLFYYPLMHLNEFLIGNLVGIYFVKKTYKECNYDWHILGVGIAIILVWKFPIGLSYHNGLLAILFIPLIVLISLNTGLWTRLFKNKFLVFLGEISFSVYILQHPVWLWVNNYRMKKYLYIDKTEDFTLSFFIRLFILIVVSAISYVYFEKPIREKLKNYHKNTNFTFLLSKQKN